MSNYECTSCGFIYNEDKKPEFGKKFVDMPDNWACPACHADKKRFKKLGPEYESLKKEFFDKRKRF